MSRRRRGYGSPGAPDIVRVCWDCHVYLTDTAPDPRWRPNETCRRCYDAGAVCAHPSHAPHDSADACARCGSTRRGSRHRWAVAKVGDTRTNRGEGR